MDLKALLHKISNLRDLRMAINEVKSLQKDAQVIPMPNMPKPTEIDPRTKKDVKDTHTRETKTSLAGNKNHLQHLGIIDMGGPAGTITHMIGQPGSNKHYNVHVNMHALANNQPAFSIEHAHSTGKVSDRSPELYNNIGGAVKALVNHSYNGGWK